MTALEKIFIDRLKSSRKDKGWTQKDLAKTTGLQPCAISHFEIGTRKPSFVNIYKLAHALEVSLDYLFGRDIRFGRTPKIEYARKP